MSGTKVTAIVILLLVALSGCAALDKGLDTVKVISAKVVESYCSGSENVRTAIRAEFDPVFAPNKVRIECAP